MNAAPTLTSSPPVAGLLHCDVCGRTAEFRDGELFQFVQTAWPRCCGEVMSLFLPAGKPTPTDD